MRNNLKKIAFALATAVGCASVFAAVHTSADTPVTNTIATFAKTPKLTITNNVPHVEAYVAFKKDGANVIPPSVNSQQLASIINYQVLKEDNSPVRTPVPPQWQHVAYDISTISSTQEAILRFDGGEIPAIAATLGGNHLKVKVDATNAIIPNGNENYDVSALSWTFDIYYDAQLKKWYPTQPVPVTKVTISGKSRVEKGKTLALSASITPANATEKKLTWSSSNSNVATVDQNGKVTAKSKGPVTISATSANGVRATYAVLVIEALPNTGGDAPKVKSIKIKGNKKVSVKSSIKLKAIVSPTNSTVTWSSSNSKIAKVKNGKVTGVKTGTVTIYAKAGNKKASFKIKVVAKKATYTVKKGDTLSQLAIKLKISGGWKTLYKWNKKLIPNPHLILVKQKIVYYISK